jgi:hypothetical protein
MVEKGPTGIGQFDAVHAAAHQRDAGLVFEIADWRLSEGCDVSSLFSAASVRLAKTSREAFRQAITAKAIDDKVDKDPCLGGEQCSGGVVD